MSSVNKVILVGRLGTDPELRHTNASTAVCHLSVATNRTWTDKEGQKQEEVDWHRVVVWGRQADNCHQFLQKGRQVYVEGRLHTHSYTDNNNNKRYLTEVVSSSVVFLSGRPHGNGVDASPSVDEAADSLPF